MKIKTVLFTIVTVAISSFVSCRKSGSAYTPSCSGDAPKYTADVSAVIASDCNTSGCHNTGSTKGPGALTTYAQVKNSMTAIRSQVVSGAMPKDHTLSDARRNLIVCWIDAGAKND